MTARYKTPQPDRDRSSSLDLEAVMPYERHHQPLASKRTYHDRVARHAAGAFAVLAVTLGAGMLGYHALERMSWLDAYLNATMILGGMGPVAELHTDAGKLFAGTYALIAGLVFVASVGVILAPVLHRALHKFHLDEKG